MLKRLILAAAVSLSLSAHAAEFHDYPFGHAGGTDFTYVGNLKNVTRAVGLGGVREAAYRNLVRADPDREGMLMIVPMKLLQSVDVIYRFK